MSHVLSREEEALFDRIRETVHDIEPDAEIILYGSRARGDAESDSDWDLLILLDGRVDERRVRAIEDRLFKVELATNCVLSTLVHRQDLWTSRLFQAMPFHENVTRDGIRL